MKPMLKRKVVCERMGISPGTLSRMVRQNKIPYVLIGTGKTKRTVRFVEAALNAWVARRMRGAGPTPRRDQAVTEPGAREKAVALNGKAPVTSTGAGKERAK